jgi:hypothetical protein
LSLTLALTLSLAAATTALHATTTAAEALIGSFNTWKANICTRLNCS